MSLHEWIISYMFVVFSNLIMLHIYNKISKINKKIKLKELLIVFGISIITMINGLFNYTMSKVFIHFIVVAFMNKLIYNDKTKRVIYYTLLIYVCLMILEIISSIVFLFLDVKDVTVLNKNIYLKNLYSLFLMLLLLLIFSTKITKIIIIKIENFLEKTNDYIPITITSVLIIFFSLLTFKTAIKLDSISYFLINTTLLIICLIVFVIIIKQKMMLQSSMEKQEELMKFLSTYEKIIDKNRIDRHEMQNNLLVIRSFPNKNSKEFEKTIDNFIENYKSPNTGNFKNVYNLPSGLKGIVFYKINDMQNIDIKVLSNISTPSINSFNKLNSKLYVKVCKIIGILLDNAAEAASLSQEKEVILDIYKENDKIIIYLENTFKGKINLNKINDNKYSTKGKNRGYGLFIVDKIINRTDELKLIQEIKNNRYVTILEIKTKK